MRNSYNIFFYFAFVVNLCNAQTTYFNKTYDYFNEAETGSSVLQTDEGGYLIAGQVITTTYRGLYFVKTDEYGDTLWRKLYKKDSVAYYSGLGGSLIKTLDGGYAIGCSVKKDAFGNPNNSDALFVKLNSNGDTVFTKTFSTALWEVFDNCIQNPDDGSYILAGAKQINSSNLDMYLVKLDSNGNFLWQKTFGGNGSERASSVATTADGGYMLVGHTNSYGAGDFDVYIIKTDSAGNKLWQKTFGGINSDGAGSVCRLLSGDYLITGGSITNFLSSQGYAIKIDSAGNKIWEKFYGGKGYDSFDIVPPIEIPDGNIVLGGVLGDIVPPNNPLGWLMKVSANGDSLWSRTFAKWDGQNYFTDIKQTNDEGFIISGYAGNGLGIGGGQDMWLIKTDSLGCDTAGCFITDIKATVANNNQPFFVYPNPFREYAYIKVNDMFAFGGELRVVDIIGRIIKNFKILYPQQTEVIFSSEIGCGIFLVQYVKDGIIESTQKIIILK